MKIKPKTISVNNKPLKVYGDYITMNELYDFSGTVKSAKWRAGPGTESVFIGDVYAIILSSTRTVWCRK